MGGQRKFRAARCGDCGLHVELCACAEMPRVSLDFGPLIVQHNRERNKPTNTGRLVHLVAQSSELVRYAVRGHDFDSSPLQRPGLRYVLFFHRPAGEPDDGRPRIEWEELRAPDTPPWRLVVLDGTWAQCSRMARRIEPVARMPMISLPQGAPSRWLIRDESEADRLSTIEAVIRATALAGREREAASMSRWFHLVAARMQFMKGYRSRPEVPPEWDDPVL